LKTFTGTIVALSLDHSLVATPRYFPLARWSFVTLSDIENYQGHKIFEWLNSDIDAQCSGLTIGDKITLLVNDLHIPLQVTPCL
jgi:hypothetical protein